MQIRPGVVSLQGAFAKHVEAFAKLGFDSCTLVREPSDLREVTHLVIPGGESSTVGKLMSFTGLDQALKDSDPNRLAIWGTCMGMIVMAREVEGKSQPTLSLLDIVVKRNAFGAQVHSFEDQVIVSGIDGQVSGVFIRAPIVTNLGKNVEALSVYQNMVIAVKQNRRLGTSFHPELTDDLRIHQYFLKL